MMNVIPMIQERRCRRSEETYRAITFQLEHVLRLHGLRNFTLSDANGLILANAGHAEESHALAAYAPLLARATDRRRRAQVVDSIREVVPFSGEDAINVRSFFIDGDRLFLCIVGEGGARLDASLYRALTGIRRIYRQSLRD